VTIRFQPLLIVVLLTLSACGAEDERATTAGAGASSPAAAVEAFAAVAGEPTENSENFAEACERISPAARPGLRLDATVKPDERACPRALSLALYYTGDTGDVPVPEGFTAEAGDVVERGDRAFVSVRMAYRGVPGAERTVQVLTVREAGQWWVATPFAFNPINAAEPAGQAELVGDYEALLGAARGAEKQAAAGEEASSALAADVDPCPRAGASAARDARADVALADGGNRAERQRPSDDLLEVVHNADGDDACFALRFAGAVPPRGGVELAIRPDGGRVTVRWEAGRVLGQRTGADDEPTPVRVAAARDGGALVIRLPRRELSIAAPAYRWAVTTFVPTDRERVTHMDKVPDDQTVTGEQDRSIRHGG